MIFLVPNYISITVYGEWVSTSIPTNTVNRRILGNVDIVATQWFEMRYLQIFVAVLSDNPPRLHTYLQSEKKISLNYQKIWTPIFYCMLQYFCVFRFVRKKAKVTFFFSRDKFRGHTLTQIMEKCFFPKSWKKKIVFHFSQE